MKGSGFVLSEGKIVYMLRGQHLSPAKAHASLFLFIFGISLILLLSTLDPRLNDNTKTAQHEQSPIRNPDSKRGRDR